MFFNSPKEFDIAAPFVRKVDRWTTLPRDGEIPVIFAVDEPESTIYVLLRPGKPPLSAAWPQPLEKICPEAKRIATQTGGPIG